MEPIEIAKVIKELREYYPRQTADLTGVQFTEGWNMALEELERKLNLAD